MEKPRHAHKKWVPVPSMDKQKRSRRNARGKKRVGTLNQGKIRLSLGVARGRAALIQRKEKRQLVQRKR